MQSYNFNYIICMFITTTYTVLAWELKSTKIDICYLQFIKSKYMYKAITSLYILGYLHANTCTFTTAPSSFASGVAVPVLVNFSSLCFGWLVTSLGGFVATIVTRPLGNAFIIPSICFSVSPVTSLSLMDSNRSPIL